MDLLGTKLHPKLGNGLLMAKPRDDMMATGESRDTAKQSDGEGIK